MVGSNSAPIYTVWKNDASFCWDHKYSANYKITAVSVNCPIVNACAPLKVFYVWMIELWLLFRQKITQGIVWMYSYGRMTRFFPLLLISCLQLVNASNEKASHSTFWSARSPKEWLWFEWLHMVCVRNDDVFEMNSNNGIEHDYSDFSVTPVQQHDNRINS